MAEDEFHREDMFIAMQNASQQYETVCPASQAQWREWLHRHHLEREQIWLIYYKKASNKPSLSWSQAVDEALCFGWIDSTKKSLDGDRYMQLFSRRKPASTWSSINKEKVTRLAEHALISPEGLRVIELAKGNGSWNSLDEVEALLIPADLAQAFASQHGAAEWFEALSKSAKKALLMRLLQAKKAETRAKRVAEIVASTLPSSATPSVA
ncbi:YdeI/OmpD-associated family protein [Aeromonas eucrenophila]|uniref:YdeI family protein n=1 Tax=Aeromonas eucrenophila TaxID=649 RepID=A0ABW0YGC1_9GAMM|nr:YdeI/OmpD-associated family protein [Aeromonas eucrenophila]